jgi:steroid delta-isomerase-like uncharacterized protein
VSSERNKSIERRMVTEALNKGDLAVVDRCLTPDFVYHGPGSVEVKGQEGYKQFLARLRAMYPDIHVKIENILAEGDLVATRTMCTFTFKSPAGDITAAGKPVAMAGTILDRFKDGKIAETWELYDRLDLYQQLGIIPVRGQDR